jgi:hypothetical protein
MERVPCEPNPNCKFYKSGSCYKNRHHLYYPRSDYRTPLEKQFRSASEHIVTLCRSQHEQLHLKTKPPEKPSPDTMREVLRGYREMEKIRDRGNSVRRAEEIQHVVQFLGQVSACSVTPVVIERPDAAQLGYTMQPGWDSEGRYIFPEK